MPMGIMLDHTGSLYVAGYYSNNIHVISPEGVLMKITSPKEAHFNKPIFLMENEGKIFVTYDKHKITSLH
jgi:streptogramin lyase